MEKAFSVIGNLISAASVSKQPTDTEIQAFIKPCADQIVAVKKKKKKKKKNK